MTQRVNLVDDTGRVLKSFDSVNQAAEFAGISPATLSWAFNKYWPKYYALAAGRLWDKVSAESKEGLLTCPACEKAKPKASFYVNRSRSTGRSWCCKECEKKRTAKYRALRTDD
jgi:hypothetical protein